MFGAAALLVILGAADATPPTPPPTQPMVIPRAKHTIAAATSGIYTMDKNHMAVIAKITHLGFSVSYFRFAGGEASLDWDAKAPSHSKLTASIDTASITTPVPGFAEELQGADYLDTKTYPKATFVSTAFRQKDSQHGEVDGNFTLKGVTKKVTFKVTLIGAGPGFAGGPQIGHVIGIHAETQFNGNDFKIPAILSEAPIGLSIDAEFDKLP